MVIDYPYIFLIIGIIILGLSGNFLVDSSVALSRHFKVSTLVIGLVIVSLGTSAPELIVSLKAAIDGFPDMSLGNVVGSNIANVALVLALTSIILPIQIKKKKVWIDWMVMMLASIALFAILLLFGEINRFGGIIFTSFLLIYIFYSMMSSRKENKKNVDTEYQKPKYNLFLSIVILLGSCVGLYFGADFLISSSTVIARDFDVSERVISLTVIAFGTSVPELVASLVAAIKKEMDISIGNIVGSNLFNILAILGISSIVSNKPIRPLDFDSFVFNDIIWMLVISAAIILPILLGGMKRWMGVIFVLAYITYVYFLF